MAAIIPLKVNGSWVNICGELANPRFVFLVDKRGKNIIDNLATVGVDPRDQIVQFAVGDFINVKDFLSLKAREYEGVMAIVSLWIGMEEIAEEEPEASVREELEQYLHPLGPRVFPRSVNGTFVKVEEVTAGYVDIISHSLSILPSLFFSTDPAPCRSNGFAITRANHVSMELGKRGAVADRHHHFSLNRHFHGKRSGKGGNAVGGKLPLYDIHFENGLIPTLEAWAVVFSRSYAAVDSFMAAVPNPALAESLSFVKISF